MDHSLFESLLKKPSPDEDLVKFALDAACLHGLMINPPQTPEHLLTPLPLALLPSPFPREAYLQAVEVQTHVNSLMDRVSRDVEFLEQALSSVMEVDDFTARLFNIYRRIQSEGKLPSVVLGLNRCDYMVEGASALKQVEINTFAAGLAGVAVRVLQLHRDVLTFTGRQEESRRLLDNDAAVGTARAMAKAWELYGSDRAVVLLLDSVILCDHRFLELELLKWNISVIHRTFEDVLSSGSLDQDDRLFVDGQEVALVYFRYGYSPQHYPSEQFWDMRLMLERSRAVKCPDIATHLCGTKKVQQVLSQPGALERFFPGQPRVVEQLRDTFTGLYSLDQGPDGDRAVQMALAAPERFVLKPQREGGGNNVFGRDLSSVLERASGPERAAFVLMEKIESRPSPNVLLLLQSRQRPPVVADCTSELGVFGAYVRSGSDLLINEAVGHVLRTKAASVSECGLCAGTAGLGSALLV